MKSYVHCAGGVFDKRPYWINGLSMAKSIGYDEDENTCMTVKTESAL
ncbi:MAG: hypothetical protein R3C68_07905 [Myxococcota bacterium]